LFLTSHSVVQLKSLNSNKSYILTHYKNNI